MLYLLISSFLLPVGGANVDVEGAFHDFCKSYCGSGGFAMCDIGNGKISLKSLNDTKTGLKPEWVVGAKHPGKSNQTAFSLGGCDEKSDPKSCKDGKWCDFDYKCTATSLGYSDTQYSNIKSTPVDDKDGFVFTHFIDNDTPNEQSTTVEFDESTTNSASISLTNTVNVGFSYKITAEVPLVMKEEFTESFSLTTSQTNTNTMTTSTGWKISQPVVASPRSTVKATLVIQKVTVSGDWSATLSLPEFAKVWCNDKVDDHYEWFIPSENYLKGPCIGEKCPVTGKFSGFHGVSSSVTLKDCPLYSRDC